MQTFDQNISELVEAIEGCLEKHWLLPCLTLLYSGIDVLASLERRPKEANRPAFVRWVDENLLSASPLPCTALELYAARCGIVHAFTADSDLSRRGRARRVIYAWGAASPEDLAMATKLAGRTEVAVHLEDLVDAFRAGLSHYFDQVARSPERQRLVNAGTGLWFDRMDQNVVKAFLRSQGRG